MIRGRGGVYDPRPIAVEREMIDPPIPFGPVVERVVIDPEDVRHVERVPAEDVEQTADPREHDINKLAASGFAEAVRREYYDG